MLVAFIAVTFILAGLVKGVVGLGLPTVAVGLLGLVMPPAQAAALLVVPSLVTNAWQLAGGSAIRPLLRRLWPMLLGIAAGTWFAAGSLTAGRAPAVAMGLALAGYGALGLARLPVHVPSRLEPMLGALAGLVNGIITAATGTFVLPSVPFIGALGLAREDLIQALGLSFTVSTLALAAALGPALFNSDAIGASLLALVPALIGMWAGTWLRTRVHPDTFRRLFYVGLLALGADLAVSNAL